MSVKEEDIVSVSTFAVERVNTAEPFSGLLPSRLQAHLKRPVAGDTSHYAREMNIFEGPSVSLSLDDESKEEVSEIDTTAPYLAGFAIGWFTWIFGLLLCVFAGKDERASALRKGLIVGAVSVSIPVSVVLTFVIIIINRWNAFLDKFPVGLLKSLFGS